MWATAHFDGRSGACSRGPTNTNERHVDVIVNFSKKIVSNKNGYYKFRGQSFFVFVKKNLKYNIIADSSDYYVKRTRNILKYRTKVSVRTYIWKRHYVISYQLGRSIHITWADICSYIYWTVKETYAVYQSILWIYGSSYTCYGLLYSYSSSVHERRLYETLAKMNCLRKK